MSTTSQSAERKIFAKLAWLGGGVGFASGVLIGHDAIGVITDVRTGIATSDVPVGTLRLNGDICVPGAVNAHSHAFHRALRGVSETRSGDFWTWRNLTYAVASRLNPESHEELASAVYGEMLLAGYTSVGEFHYLHHDAGGVAYADPNAMGSAIGQAASRARIRLTLIDACYLQAGTDGEALEGVQLRFSDRSGEKWAGRVQDLLSTELPHTQRLGVAIHSVRAVPRPAIGTVVAVAHEHEIPLHVHLSEQRRENEQCLKSFSLTPTDVLHSAGAVNRTMTAVHATHLSPGDIGRLGLANCNICVCPTSERDLGDGVGPFSDLASAGAVLSIGSDSQAVIDPFEETRAIELNERLIEERRGLWSVSALLDAATTGGARSLGWPEGGIREGAMADLVTLNLDSPRLAGPLFDPSGSGDLDPASSEQLLARVIFGAAAPDVDTVVVGGEVVVESGEHITFGPPRALAERLGREIRKALGVGP